MKRLIPYIQYSQFWRISQCRGRLRDLRCVCKTAQRQVEGYVVQLKIGCGLAEAPM